MKNYVNSLLKINENNFEEWKSKMKRKTRKIKGLLFYRGIIRKKVGILMRDKVRKMMEKKKIISRSSA